MTLLLLMIFKVLHPLVDIIHFIHDVYRRNARPTTKNYVICKQYANYCQIIVKYLLSSVATLILIMIISSLIEYYMSGIKITPIDLYFPGVADYSDLIFGFVLIYNYAVILVNFTVHNASLLLIYVIFVNILLLSSIIVNEMDELQQCLGDGNKSDGNIGNRLIKIIYTHKRYGE